MGGRCGLDRIVQLDAFVQHVTEGKIDGRYFLKKRDVVGTYCVQKKYGNSMIPLYCMRFSMF